MKLRLKCRGAAQLLSERQDRRLATADGVRLRMHLFACDACRTVERQLELLRRAVQRIADDEPEQPPS